MFDTPLLGVDGWLKRVEDLAIGIVAVIVTAPLMLAIAAAVGRGFGAPSTPGTGVNYSAIRRGEPALRCSIPSP